MWGAAGLGSFTAAQDDHARSMMDARLGMTEGRRVSIGGIRLGSDPSLRLDLSEVEWIKMTMRKEAQANNRGEFSYGPRNDGERISV